MKQVITILLLLIMAVQAGSHFCLKHSQFYAVQDMDDKNDDESKKEKKEVKEYVLIYLPVQQRFINKVNLFLTSVNITPSPVIDHLTPPPDVVFAC